MNSPAQTPLSLNEPSPRIAGLLLVLAVILVYGNFFHNPLVFDDLGMLANEQVLRDYGASFFTFDLRWFSYVTFGWIYKLAGMNLVWQRLVNLLLHAATVLALYRFLALLFRTTAKEQGADHLAFWGALIFAVHPVAVYGAGYLIERSIVMATLFSVLALHAFLKGLIGGERRWLFLSALPYFLAVFSKEHAVMLPAAIAAMTLLARRPSVALLREMAAPFALFFAIAILVVLKTKGVLGQPYEPFAMDMLAAQAENQLGFDIKDAYPLSILMEGLLFFKYLGLWLLPYVGWMSVDLRAAFPGGFFSWPDTFGFLAFAAYPFLAAKLLLRGGKTGLLGFALLFPWLMFLTEFSAVRIQEPFVLYRSYLWMLALPALLPAAVGRFAPRRVNAALGVAVLLLAASAWNRLDSFSSALKLWDDVVAKNTGTVPGAERGYLNRGLAKKGMWQLEGALADYDQAIRLNPKYPTAYSNRASVYIALDRYAEALDDLNRAIAIKPGYATPYINRGVLKNRSGRYQEAIDDYGIAIAMAPAPYHAHIYSNRGVARMNLGDEEGALQDFEAALRLDASNVNATLNLRMIRERMKNGRQSGAR